MDNSSASSNPKAPAVKDMISPSGMSSGSKGSGTSVETTVTKLLISTKQLLQTLTQWSKSAVTEKAVSDAYVQLGNDLKVVSKIFRHLGIEVSDLANVTINLRKVLETALRQSPSEETLNKYLPSIREIIVALLDKLKVKQAHLKVLKQEKSSSHKKTVSSISAISETASLSSTTSNSREPSIFTNMNQDKTASSSSDEITSSNLANTNLENNHNDDNNNNININGNDNVKPSNTNISDEKSNLIISKTRTVSETDALKQLKHGSNLQRRASKRFSAYQMAKLTNQSVNDAQLIPKTSIDLNNSENKSEINSARDQAYASLSSGVEYSSEKETVSKIENSISSSTFENFVLFLELKKKVKKCKVSRPNSINELRLLFVKEFAFSPGTDAFPEFYIKDKTFNEYYELNQSNFADLEEGSVLKLYLLEGPSVNNHELTSDGTAATSDSLAQLAKALKSEMRSLQSLLITEIRSVGNSSTSSNQDFTKEKEVSANSTIDSNVLTTIKQELSELQRLRKKESEEFKKEIQQLLEKNMRFKTQGIASSTSDKRSYLEKSQTKLGDVSDNLLSRVDDIQDIIEVVRKDVAIRGVKPSKRKIDGIYKQLQQAKVDLESMQSFISEEKPQWKKIWEAELEKVCEEQQFLTLQEDLAFDLAEDLKKVSETFDLVKLCCEEQEKNPKKTKANPVLPIPKPGSLNKVRDQLLVEVQSLNPNHEGRVDALEKAQKMWIKEREFRENDEFEDELEEFVENSNFKRSGGFEEIENMRRKKDEEMLKSNFGVF